MAYSFIYVAVFIALAKHNCLYSIGCVLYASANSSSGWPFSAGASTSPLSTPSASGANSYSPAIAARRLLVGRFELLAPPQRAGLGHVRSHDLRHTFVTRMLDLGIPIEQVNYLAGHKSMAMTKRYDHANEERYGAARGIGCGG